LFLFFVLFPLCFSLFFFQLLLLFCFFFLLSLLFISRSTSLFLSCLFLSPSPSSFSLLHLAPSLSLRACTLHCGSLLSAEAPLC
jgi:hypothetical protein